MSGFEGVLAFSSSSSVFSSYTALEAKYMLLILLIDWTALMGAGVMNVVTVVLLWLCCGWDFKGSGGYGDFANLPCIVESASLWVRGKKTEAWKRGRRAGVVEDLNIVEWNKRKLRIRST